MHWAFCMERKLVTCNSLFCLNKHPSPGICACTGVHTWGRQLLSVAKAQLSVSVLKAGLRSKGKEDRGRASVKHTQKVLSSISCTWKKKSVGLCYVWIGSELSLKGSCDGNVVLWVVAFGTFKRGRLGLGVVVQGYTARHCLKTNRPSPPTNPNQPPPPRMTKSTKQ